MQMTPYSKIIVALAVAILIIGMAIIPAEAVMLVSRSEEVSIGKQVESESIKQYGGLYKNPSMTARVQKVGAQVAAVSTRKDVKYTFKVVNSDVINAFSAPGGPVLITKALVNLLTTDSELAFVLGHETGHIAAQHGRNAINRSMIAQGMASLLFGKTSDVVQQGAGIMYTLYDRGYSRSQEYQADSLGVRFMKAAGYDQEGSIKALAKLGIQRSSGINKYLATHPDIPDRINRIAQSNNISEARKQKLIQEVTAKSPVKQTSSK